MITKISGGTTNLHLRVSVLLCLMCFMFMGTSCSQSAKQDTEKETAKSQNQDTIPLLLAYVDSLSKVMASNQYTEKNIKAISDYFAKGLPIAAYHSEESNTNPSILVTTRLSEETTTADIVNISLPESVRSAITFAALVNHFGPLTPENKEMPRPRQPFPAQINLDKHLGLADSGVSLFILATDFPEVKINSINQIQVVKIKK